MTTDPSFKFHIPLEAFEKADDGNPMRIGGIVSTDQLDKQGERILQEGLDFRPFLNEGWFNDNHGRNTTDVVGYPTDVRFVKKGETLPTGRKATTNGWWAEGYLLNTAKGRELWGIAQALHKSPRRLAFSIEGKATQRDHVNPLLVRRGLVKHVAVTHCPVNTGTELHALTKALTAGSSVTNPGAAPGEGFALRGESLEGSPDHPETTPISSGMGDDLNDGGIAGTNPHAGIAKAVDQDFQVVDEFSELASWAPHVAKMVKGAQPDPLTKSEARVIVSNRFPNLSADQVDAFVATLSK